MDPTRERYRLPRPHAARIISSSVLVVTVLGDNNTRQAGTVSRTGDDARDGIHLCVAMLGRVRLCWPRRRSDTNRPIVVSRDDASARQDCDYEGLLQDTQRAYTYAKEALQMGRSRAGVYIHGARHITVIIPTWRPRRPPHTPTALYTRQCNDRLHAVTPRGDRTYDTPLITYRLLTWSVPIV